MTTLSCQSYRLNRCIQIFFISIILCLPFTQSYGQDNSFEQISSPEQLLERVKAFQQAETTRLKDRESRFLNHKNQQQTLLKQAKQDFEKAQQASNPLLKQTALLDQEIADLKATRNKAMSEIGDIESIFEQFSADLDAQLRTAITQSEVPQRQQQLSQLAQQGLPSISNIETLWLILQEEMTMAAQINRYSATVINSQGLKTTQDITRVGSFAAVSAKGLLSFDPQAGVLREHPGLPDTMNDALINFNIQNAASSDLIASFIIDPSQGELWNYLSQIPSLQERIIQGKEVGMVIIMLGALGLMISLWRLLVLLLHKIAINKQLSQLTEPSTSNALGRVLLAAQQMPSQHEALQASLDQAVLLELPKLEKGNSLVKLLAAIAPLLGLLGTVIGMIVTFQSISLYGSGDPKLMASGISQALVTTVLGLVVAIPLLLSHNFLVSLSRQLVQILDEQSAAIVAKQFFQTSRGHDDSSKGLD